MSEEARSPKSPGIKCRECPCWISLSLRLLLAHIAEMVCSGYT